MPLQRQIGRRECRPTHQLNFLVSWYPSLQADTVMVSGKEGRSLRSNKGTQIYEKLPWSDEGDRIRSEALFICSLSSFRGVADGRSCHMEHPS